ncbi:Rotatin [Oopsacas minuta]|uniref:Rotatin n=1 Tax=Oopsacas minuta TaxID=111878 RepID=A0AAV7K356_9METZ|nr:Rotatin [Oopsacas minuta]
MDLSTGNKPETASSNLRSILAKVGHNNIQIRASALKRIVFKLDSNLITLSDLIHEREFILNLMEWFNHSDITHGYDVLNLLLKISEYPIPARYLNSIGAVTYLSQLRQDINESERCILDNITDNLLHTSNFDVPKDNTLIPSRYIELYDNNDTVSNTVYPVAPTNISIHTSLTIPSDLSQLSITSHSLQPVTKHNLITNNSTQILTQSDRTIIQKFIMTSRDKNEVKPDILLSIERMFSEYQLNNLVSFHNFSDALVNLNSSIYQQETPIQSLYTLNLINHILTTYKLHSNLSKYISYTQPTCTSVNMIQFITNILDGSNTNLECLLAKDCITPVQLRTISIQLDVITKSIETLTAIYYKSNENNSELISDTFVLITTCIQIIRSAIIQESNRPVLVIILSGLVVVSDKLCVFLRYIESQSVSEISGTSSIYTLLDLACSSMLSSWLPQLRTYVSPFLNIITPDTDRIFSRFLEVEDKYKLSMDLVRIANRIRLKKCPIEMHYLTVLSLCQDSLSVISLHNDCVIVECIVEISYWLLHEKRMGINDDVIELLARLLETYHTDQSIAIYAIHKLCSLLKHELSVKDVKIFPFELVELLANYSVILNDMDVNVWSSTWQLVFFLATKVDNGMLLESISKWIGEFQMKANETEMIENIFKRITNKSAKINLEISKVYIRFCYHKNDEIRSKATNFLRNNLEEGVRFREDFLLNCRPPVTEHKVGFRVPFHTEDVQKILNIMTSPLLEVRIILSAFEQLCILLQDPKLHSLMSQPNNLSHLIDSINKNIPENVDLAHASIYSLRLLTQFNRKLALHLSNDAKLFASLLYWTQYTVEPIQTYNLSKLLFLLVFVHSLRYNEVIQISRTLQNTIIIPFDVVPTDFSLFHCEFDSYRDLLEHRHIREGLINSWQCELTRNKYEYSKMIRKQFETNFKFVSPITTLTELLKQIPINEEELIAANELLNINLSYTQIENITCVKELMNMLLHNEIPTKIQLICYKIIFKLSQPQNKYTEELIFITETICTGKHEFYTRFKSLLEMVTCSKMTPILLLEYRDYLHLYHQLANSLASLPNLHTHIVYITFYTSVLTALKHDIIPHYHDIQLLLKSIGKLIRPNGQAKRFLCYSQDKLYLTLILRVKLLSEDTLISSVKNTNSANQSIITDSLYNLQCTLNVLNSAKQTIKVTTELISILTQLITASEEIQILVLSSFSVIAQNISSIDTIDGECMTLYGHRLLDICKSYLFDQENRSCLVKEQVCYLIAVICKYIVVDGDTVVQLIAHFTSQNDYVQSLYCKDRVKTPKSVNISLLASLTTLLTELLNSNQLNLEQLCVENIYKLYIFYSDTKLLMKLKLSTALHPQFELINSLSSLIVVIISIVNSSDYTNVLYRTWSLIEFTDTHSQSSLPNYIHAYTLISKLVSHEPSLLCQFIQLIHSNSHVLLESLGKLVDSETVVFSESIMPLSVLSNVTEMLNSLIEQNPKEYSVHGEILSEFFDSHKLACNTKLVNSENTKLPSVTNGAKITEIILNIISKTHPISKGCVANDFNLIETELSVFISSSKEVCIALEKCGFLSNVIDEYDVLTTKLYKFSDKSHEYREVAVSLQTKCSLLANIFCKIPTGKELNLKEGLLGIISKLWPFTRNTEMLEKSVIYLLTVLTNKNEKICRLMSQPQGGPNLLSDVIKRVTSLLKRVKNEKFEFKLTTHLLTLVGNTCIAMECRRFIQKIGLISELHCLLENTREKRCKIPRLIISNTLLLLTKLNSYEDGRKILFQYKEVLEFASEIGQEHFKDTEIMTRVLFLIHNQSFSHSSKPYILSNSSILSLLDNALLTQDSQYMDLVGNTISALLCNFNKGKFILKKTKLVKTLRETNNLLVECRSENKYLAQAMLYVDTTQSEVQYN